MSAREQQKELRRQRTLNAAEALIRKTGATDFSMLTLASRAKLSPATPYNLFGSKSSILYALLNRSMDEIFKGAERAFAHQHPLQRVLKAAMSAAKFLISDPDFYRPLYGFLLGVDDPVYRPDYMNRSLGYWNTALAGMEQGGLLPKEVSCDQLARQLVIQYVGAVDLWVHEELGDAEFMAQTSYGTALQLLGIANGDNRKLLLGHLRATKRKLPRQFSFSKIS